MTSLDGLNQCSFQLFRFSVVQLLSREGEAIIYLAIYRFDAQLDKFFDVIFSVVSVFGLAEGSIFLVRPPKKIVEDEPSTDVESRSTEDGGSIKLACDVLHRILLRVCPHPLEKELLGAATKREALM